MSGEKGAQGLLRLLSGGAIPHRMRRLTPLQMGTLANSMRERVIVNRQGRDLCCTYGVQVNLIYRRLRGSCL